MMVRNQKSYRFLLVGQTLIFTVTAVLTASLLKGMTTSWVWWLFLVQFLLSLGLGGFTAYQFLLKKAFRRGYIKWTDERYLTIQSKSQELANQSMLFFLGVAIGFEGSTRFAAEVSLLPIDIFEFSVFLLVANVLVSSLAKLWYSRVL